MLLVVVLYLPGRSNSAEATTGDSEMIQIYVAGLAKGQYTERFLAASWDAAVEGFKTKFGKDAGFVAEGSAWLNHGELVTQPAKSQNYRDKIAVDAEGILAAIQAARPAEPVLAPATSDLDVFFDAMEDYSE